MLKRIYFLDNFRAIVVILVIVLHGAMSYMLYAPDWWYVLDTQRSRFFTGLVLLIDIPLMLIMFFIAGYFTLPSLAKRGTGGFLKDKLTRIGLPWLFGVIFLAPPIAYLAYYTRGVPMSFLQFWRSDFWTVAYQQSVYWFLGVLLFLFIGFALVHANSEQFWTRKSRYSKPGWAFWLAFWAIMSMAMLVLHQFFPMDSWYTRAYILVFQPLRVPLYIGYFGLGIYAHLSGWFSIDGYKPRLLPWAGLWFFSGVLYLVNRLEIMPANPDLTYANQMTYVLLFNAFCLSSLMAGAALLQSEADKTGPFWGSLSTNSYGMYYIHPLILYPLAYLFVPISLPLFVKAPLVILLGIFLSWAASAYILTRAPILRRAFA